MEKDYPPPPVAGRSKRIVNIAVGIVAGWYHLTTREAYLVLRDEARASNCQIYDRALAVVSLHDRGVRAGRGPELDDSDDNQP